MVEHDLNLPAYNEQAEQSVLGGILLDNTAFDRIAGMVNEGDFYITENRRIFRAISKLCEKNQPVDIVTVAEELENNKLLSEVGGFAYIGSVAQNTPSAANIVRYAEIVREKSLLRSMAQVSHEVSTRVLKPGTASAKELLDYAQGKWMSVGEQMVKAKDTMRHVGVVMDSVLQNIDALYNRDLKDDITGLRSGLNDLDKMTAGFQPGDLVIVGARPSMGKTSLALNFIEQIALTDKKNVLFFSLEMINNQLGMRLLSSVSNINQHRVKVARVNESEMGRLAIAAERLRDAGIYLDEESGLNVGDIKARARRVHRECTGGLQAIFIDYLQLMEHPQDNNKADAIGDTTRALKNLAKELHLPVICLSQLNRGLEQRPNKRPVMSDLRDSGAIEQDADLALFIYRDEVYNPEGMDGGYAEIIIGKQRNGPIGTVNCKFNSGIMRFENLAMGEVVPSVENFKHKSFNKQNSRGNFRDENYEPVEM